MLESRDMANTKKRRAKAEVVNAWNDTRSNKSSNGRLHDFTASCFEHVRQYLLNTSLHGLKYVGLSSITLFERWACFSPKDIIELILLCCYPVWQCIFSSILSPRSMSVHLLHFKCVREMDGVAGYNNTGSRGIVHQRFTISGRNHLQYEQSTSECGQRLYGRFVGSVYAAEFLFGWKFQRPGRQ